MRFLKVIVLFITVFGSHISFSQELQSADTLIYQRKVFHSTIYRGHVKLSKSSFASLLAESEEWYRKNRRADLLLPMGPVISLGGVYLAYDAIKGVPMVTNIEGESYPYVVRSLPKLLGGLVLFVTGLSMIESANETKSNAVKWHNELEKLKKEQYKTTLKWKLEAVPSGGIGLTANF
jgi:hypothetical protein